MRRLPSGDNLLRRGHILPIDTPMPAAGILQPKHSQEPEQISALPAPTENVTNQSESRP